VPYGHLLGHHRRFVDETGERFQRESSIEALILGGSVAHGLARPDSDLDVMLVVSDEEFVRRTETHEMTFSDMSAGGYDGGYLDAKYVSRRFIAEVAHRGSEPARWAFADSIVVFSRADGLEELVRRASAYPEEQRDEKIRNFMSHAILMTWFHSEAAKRDDPYLAAYASSRLTLYAGRAILAHNRLLYPFHKWFTTVLERAPLRPPDLLELMAVVISEPTEANARALTAAVVETVGVEISIAEASSRFTEQTEWSWRYGRLPLDEG
jgi:hypothetical protein